MLLWLIVTAGAAAMLLKAGRSPRESRFDRLRRLSGVEGGAAAVKGSLPRRAGITAAALDLPARVLPRRLRQRLARGLSSSVQRSGYSEERLVALRAWCCFVLPGLAAAVMRFSTVALVAFPVLAALGWYAPVLLASRRERELRAAVQRALPHASDILYAQVLGGRNLDQALRGAARSSPEPVRSLLSQAVREMELGSPRGDAFERLKERCRSHDLATLLGIILEAERTGSRPAPVLEVYSREIRQRNRDMLRSQVAKAPLKMLFPLVFLVLPASILLTVGPTFLATVSKVLK